MSASIRPVIRDESKCVSHSVQCLADSWHSVRPTHYYMYAFISVYLPNNLMRLIFLICPFYEWEYSSSEMLNNHPRSYVPGVLTGLGYKAGSSPRSPPFYSCLWSWTLWSGTLGSTVLGWLHMAVSTLTEGDGQAVPSAGCWSRPQQWASLTTQQLPLGYKTWPISFANPETLFLCLHTPPPRPPLISVTLSVFRRPLSLHCPLTFSLRSLLV